MFFGSGIIKGLLVTLKNFAASYFLPPDKGGLFTVEYPEKRIPTFERFRNFPFLVYDNNDPEQLRCTACEICAKECPPKCITVVRDSDKDGKPLKKPAVFDIDFGICMNCGICEEVCPFDSIFMNHEFEITTEERHEALLYHKAQLSKANEYFLKIRPEDALAIDAKRRAVEEKKKAAQIAAAQAAQSKQQPKPPEQQGPKQ